MRVKLCSRRKTRIGSPIRKPGSPRNARSRRSTGHFGGMFEPGVQLDEREIVQVTKAFAPESSNGMTACEEEGRDAIGISDENCL